MTVAIFTGLLLRQPMSAQFEIRERVTNEIIEALQKGIAPWRKPWTDVENSGFPTNVVSKKLYRGINPILLQFAAQRRNFTSKWWATYQQWASIGGQVKKRPADVQPGSWGTKVIFWKPIKTTKKNANGEEEQATFPLMREYTVFCADQVEGEAIDKYRTHAPTTASVIDFEPAEKVIAATGAEIRHVAGGQAAYFCPPQDYIVMPLKSQFVDLAGYYGTALHECVHWSEVRLGWTGSYALGELRAELGAAYLMPSVGVPQVSENVTANTASYLESWIKAMKEDSSVIFKISSAASKAADYILSFSQETQVEEEIEEVAAA
jgi:antirestriction protein ArdC